MSKLSALASVLKWGERGKFCTFELYTEYLGLQTEVDTEIEKPRWHAVLMHFDLIRPAEVFNKRTFEEACGSLLDICRLQGLDIPLVLTDDVIPHSQQTESLMVKLEKILPKFGEYPPLLSFSYLSIQEEPAKTTWEARIYFSSRMDDITVAEAKASSLYEACMKLWEECMKKLKEL